MFGIGEYAKRELALCQQGDSPAKPVNAHVEDGIKAFCVSH